jgi:hypothetical protein
MLCHCLMLASASYIFYDDQRRHYPALSMLFSLYGNQYSACVQVVVHGFMESDTYSPLLNISVIPQTSYR